MLLQKRKEKRDIMQEMRIIQTLTEYQMIKEQEKFSLFLFGSQDCAPCKALKEKITIWSVTHPQVFTSYVSIENNISLAAQENILGVPTIFVFVEGKEAIRKIRYFSLEEVFTALERYIFYSD
ncbi:thioredoxin family protein [Parvimonas micra]